MFRRSSLNRHGLNVDLRSESMATVTFVRLRFIRHLGKWYVVLHVLYARDIRVFKRHIRNWGAVDQVRNASISKSSES